MNFVSKFDGSLPFTGTHPKAQLHVETVQSRAPADAIVVKDANLLFNGDFKRTGLDLVISRDDQELVLPDYFKGDKRAALASSDGAYLTGKTIEVLTGHVQLAQADGSAAAAKIIGHVTKLSGSATVVRNGVSIVLNNGDTVYQGDVVQSGSNSTLGITFIDGSVFGLASNARMVLNEMVYDPNGSGNSSLLSLVQGTISFVAGATAKQGDMKVDTPVATMGIRGTAVLVEIDFEVTVPGTAPPVRFQVLVEPDGTTGSYVLMDRVTLTQIATVNQPGTVTTVSGAGAVAFLASAQLSPELMKLISEVFSQKFTDNTNPKSNTNFTDTVIPQTTFPVQLASGETVTATVTVIAASEGSSGTPPPQPKAPDRIPGPPGVVTFNQVLAERQALTGSSLIDTTSGSVSYTDLNPGDVPTVSTAFSSFAYANAAGVTVTSTLTLAQLSAITAVSVPLTVVQDPAGKNNGTATWTYNVEDNALDFLAQGEKLTLTYMARVDNNFAANNEFSFAPFTITITGTNDTPTIESEAQTAEIEELEGVVDQNTLDTATGTILFEDVDLTDEHEVSITGVTASGTVTGLPVAAGGPGAAAAPSNPLYWLSLGAFLDSTDGVTGSQVWNFSAEDHYFDYLAEGETVTLTYTVEVKDDYGATATQNVVVTVTGSNDAPEVAEDDVTGGVTELVTPLPTDSLTDTGTITFTDVDLSDTHSISQIITPVGALGLLTASITTDTNGTGLGGVVTWNYSVVASYVEYLAAGEVKVESFTITLDDDNGGLIDRTINVTITGTNDAPVVAAISPQNLVEQTDTSLLTTTIPVTFTDVDLIDTGHTAAITAAVATGITTGLALDEEALIALVQPGLVAKASGSSSGTVTLAFSAASTAFDYLAAGESLTLTYTVTINDLDGGVTSQEFVVTITGTNDDPVVAETDVSGEVTELVTPADDDLNDSGTIAFTDVDLTDVHSIIPSADALGSLTASLTADTNGTGMGGVVTWNYSVVASDVEYLAAGETKTESFTITLSDGNGGTIARTIVVTIIGTNDAPVIEAAMLPQVAEDSSEASLSGSSVAELFGGGFEDVDTGAHLSGVVVTANNAPSSQGVWQYQVSGTGPWYDIGSVDAEHGLALAADTLIRFVPAADYSGTPGTLAVHGLDDTYGGAFTTVTRVTVNTTSSGTDPLGTGGTSPVSEQAVAIGIDVTPAADAAAISNDPTPVAVAGEFLVNSSTTGGTSFSAVGALEDGGFVIAWYAVQDGDQHGIYAQRYDSSGAAVGSEFRVNTVTGGDQTSPFVQGLADGGYVIAWVTGGNNSATIHAQQYDSSGVAVGGELNLGTGENPSIAALTSGGYVITFTTSDADLSGTYAVIYDVSGNAGVPLLVNTTTASQQQPASVVGTPDGNFIVSWHSYGQDAGNSWGVYFQRFDASGNKIGGEVRANETVAGDQYGGKLAVLTDGSFVVVWRDQSLGTIVARHFDADGQAISGEVTIGTGTDDTVQPLPDGGYLVTYKAADASGLGLFGQRVSASDTLIGAAFPINQSTAGDQSFMSDRSNPTAVLASGTIVSTWSDVGGSMEIFARLFTVPGIGEQGTEIRLPSISAAAVDTDGSETLVLKLSGFPVGSTFSLGTAGTGSDAGKWIISGADVALLATTALKVSPPAYFNGDFTLHVDAVVSDTATLSAGSVSDIATTAIDLQVTVIADGTPALQAFADAVTTNANTAITLSSLTTNDTTVGGDAPHIVSVYNVQNGTVALNNGVPIFTPDPGFAGTASFSYWISETSNPTPPGTFNTAVNYAVYTYPQAVTLADINGDGKLDMLTSGYTSDQISFRYGNGNGTFGSLNSLTAGDAPATPVVVADFDNDGNMDLAVGNYLSDDISIFYGNGSGGYNAAINYAAGDPAGNGPEGLTGADVNGDGKVDLIVSNYDAGTVAVTLNNGNRTFQTPVEYAVGGTAGSLPYLSELADLDGDGNLDIVVGNAGSSNISVLLGNGDGTFDAAVDYETPAGSNAVAIGDVNGDGILDVVSSNGTVSVFLGNGDGTFQSETSYAAGDRTKGIALADFDEDGDLDIVVANSRDPNISPLQPQTNSVSILFNNGNGTFGQPVSYATGWDTYHVAVADLNGDGRPDIVAPNELGNDVSVLLNAAPGGALSSTTVTVNVNGGPVLMTDLFEVSEIGDVSTVTGLYVADPDPTASTQTFQIVASAVYGSVTLPDDEGLLSEINSALDVPGIIYDPGTSAPLTDKVTFTVTDEFGNSDIVNFIFNESGTGPTVTLTGTEEKDVIFATGYDDDLTGGAKADQFVFRPEDAGGNDVINDFTLGEDRIDLRGFEGLDTSTIEAWLDNPANVVQDGADTVITLDDNNTITTITLTNVTAANLSASNFIVSQYNFGL